VDLPLDWTIAMSVVNWLCLKQLRVTIAARDECAATHTGHASICKCETKSDLKVVKSWHPCFRLGQHEAFVPLARTLGQPKVVSANRAIVWFAALIRPLHRSGSYYYSMGHWAMAVVRGFLPRVYHRYPAYSPIRTSAH
jgi:hypothetical protein